MFPARFFPNRMFALRYWAKVGAEAVVVITTRPFYRPHSTQTEDRLSRSVAVADALRGKAPAVADSLRGGVDEQVQ